MSIRLIPGDCWGKGLFVFFYLNWFNSTVLLISFSFNGWVCLMKWHKNLQSKLWFQASAMHKKCWRVVMLLNSLVPKSWGLPLECMKGLFLTKEMYPLKKWKNDQPVLYSTSVQWWQILVTHILKICTVYLYCLAFKLGNALNFVVFVNLFRF